MTSKEGQSSVCRAGENCWRIEQADRLAIAIDGEDYFRALRQSILAAEHQVIIVGWEVHSKLELVRGEPDDGLPTALGPLLDFVARERKVDVFVLCWDFAVIYLLERESFQAVELDWKTHSGVRFQVDACHAAGASHHQKVVVIDDAVAYCGGFDLSQRRWDTSQHLVEDSRRQDPTGERYPPFHDLQMLVDAAAAAALGELARTRWHRATGERLRPIEWDAHSDPWPVSVAPLLQSVPVVLARTESGQDGRDSVREIEQLYQDFIASASRYIYIENQYLTSHAVAVALAKRLAAADAPEVVIVMPRETEGWLEQQTMDVLRARVVDQLRDADHAGKLRLFYPQLAKDSADGTMVHAKLMLVDDRLLLLGSANLSNRSMGLDTECDLALEDGHDGAVAASLKQLLADLLAQHLGTDTDVVARSLSRTGSLIATIDELHSDDRSLQPLDTKIAPAVDALIPDSALIDPEAPVDASYIMGHLVPEAQRPRSARRFMLAVLTLLLLLGVALAWQFTDLGDSMTPERLVAYIRAMGDHPAASLVVIGVFAVAAALAVPLTLMVVVCVLAFGAMKGFIFAYIGAQLSAILSYLMGDYLGRDMLRRYAGDTINRLSKRLSDRGVATIVTLRVVPVAPYALVNLVAGASHISLRDFLLGTLLGLVPGLLAIALFADGLLKAITGPGLTSFAWVAALLLVLGVGAHYLRRALLSRRVARKTDSNC